MAKKRPLTRDEIIEKEALHNALTRWMNGQSMETLDEAHQKNFGHNFDPYKKESAKEAETQSHGDEGREVCRLQSAKV